MEVIPSIISSIKDINSEYEEWKCNNDILLNMVIICCKYNLDLIEIHNWNNTSLDFRYEIYKKLQTEPFENVLKYGNYKTLGFLFEIINNNTLYKNENRLTAVIVKIKILKEIIELKKKYPDDGHPHLNQRIETIKNILLDILENISKK
jgi:hypothetical protein